MDAVHYSSEDQTWETPPEVFIPLNKEFGFTLDPCCLPETAKCDKYFTPANDGLLQDWRGHIVFVNPPYGKILGTWVEKCYNESRKPDTIVVALLPARTDTKYFHAYIYKKAKEIRFIKGRIKFLGGKHSAPFPSMIVVF